MYVLISEMGEVVLTGFSGSNKDRIYVFLMNKSGSASSLHISTHIFHIWDGWFYGVFVNQK